MLSVPFFGASQAQIRENKQPNTTVSISSMNMVRLEATPVMGATTYMNQSSESGSSAVDNTISNEPTPGPGGGGGGGGSPPQSISLRIDIFQGQANIQVGYNSGGNGATFTLNPYSSYQISINSINSGYKFFQWETNAGYVNNPESSSTTLNTGGSSGTLSLVLNDTSSVVTSSWAGFVQSGSISTVTGEFYVPSATYVNGGPNVVDIWVGIEGFGTTELWQGGIEIDVSSIGVETVTPWYTDYSANPLPQYVNGVQVNPGDLLQLWTNYSAGTSTFKILDRSNGQSSGTIAVSYTPNTGTAEWIVEDPGMGQNTMPGYNTVTWTSANSNSCNLISPLTSIMQKVTISTQFHQYSFEQYITEPDQFSVTFGEQNG